MAQTGEKAMALPSWDDIEAKYWESTRVARQAEDSEHSASFAVRLQDNEKAQMQLAQERAAFLDEIDELETRLSQLKDLAGRKQRAIEDLANQQALLKRTYEQERALILEERALEDEQRRDLFVMYRASNVQAFKPANPEMEPEQEPSATPSPPPARLEALRDMEQRDAHDGQQKPQAPPPAQPVVRSEAQPDVRDQLPRQTEARLEPQTQPEDQPPPPRDAQQNHHGKAKDQAKGHQLLESNGRAGLQPEADMSLAPLDDEPSHPEGEGVGEAGETLVTPLSRRASSELTSRLSTPPSELQMDIDLVSLSRGLQPIGQLGPGEKPADQPVDLTKVVVVDGYGELVGEVRPLSFTNHHIEAILTLPIRRQVQMRPGKKLTVEALEAIYKTNDNRGAKWISCYIQATGEIQEKRCNFCRISGPFQDCVVVAGDKFPRCGCCEWARRPCSFTETEQEGDGDVPTTRPSSRRASESAATVRSGKASGGFTAVNAGSARPSPSIADPAAEEGDSEMTTTDKTKSKKKKVKTVQPYKGKSDPPQTPGGAEATTEGQPPLPEITKDVLMLRDDGVVFTDPPAMRGVPLAKIKKGDPYWDDEWPDLEATVTEGLRRWEAKHEEHIAANHSTSSKFLANRQINRGKAVLRFLEDGELHPFQIMGKAYVKKQLGNYDKLFRMTQILEELTKFEINVTPSQWLRHRLCEVLEEVGDKFDLAQTVNDLYHDPKVVAIRFKSGFGNIGRPPGYKPGGDGSANKKSGEASSGQKSAKSNKRKKAHETPKATPNKAATSAAQPGAETETPAAASPSRGPRKSQPKTAAAGPSPEYPNGAPQEQQPPAPFGPTENDKAQAPPSAPSPGAKKARLNSNSELAPEDLDYDGYTTTDSFSHDRIHEEDWRLYQVKHAREQTDAHVTQYWHWIEEEQTFEHQVLSDESRKVKWGVYKEPHDFHLRLGELSEVTVAVGSNKVVVGTRPYPGVTHRGDLLVDFKRDRTKRRFVKFISRKGVKLVKTNEAFVEDFWTKIEPSFSLGQDPGS